MSRQTGRCDPTFTAIARRNYYTHHELWFYQSRNGYCFLLHHDVHVQGSEQCMVISATTMLMLVSSTVVVSSSVVVSSTSCCSGDPTLPTQNHRNGHHLLPPIKESLSNPKNHPAKPSKKEASRFIEQGFEGLFSQSYLGATCGMMKFCQASVLRTLQVHNP